MFGTLVFLAKWAGFRSKFSPWGDPIEFSKALPVFPIVGGLAFAYYVLWPWRHKNEDDPF